MKFEKDSNSLLNFCLSFSQKLINVFMRLKPFQIYYIRVDTVGFKKWLFRLFNISFKGVDYYDRGVRILGWTFIWTKYP